MIKVLALTAFLFFSSFGSPAGFQKEQTLCDALRQITQAIKNGKHEGLMGVSQEADYFASKIDIAKWQNEQVYYVKKTEFSFSASYDGKDAGTVYQDLKKSLAKCLKLEALVMEMADGESLLFEFSETIKIAVDYFNTQGGANTWIDLKVTGEL